MAKKIIILTIEEFTQHIQSIVESYSKEGEYTPPIVEPTDDHRAISPYHRFTSTPFIFYVTNSFGRVAFLTIKIKGIKKFTDGVAVINGDIVYDCEQMDGNIRIDFNKNRVQYTERKTRYRYNMEIDNRCVRRWNEFLKEISKGLR